MKNGYNIIVPNKLEILKGSKFFPLGKGEKFYALKGVDFFWEEKDDIGVVGETGSGKSTLARLLTGLLKPDEGKVLFNGKNINSFKRLEMRKFRKEVQMVFQNPSSSLNPLHKVKKILREPFIVHKIEKSKRDFLVEDILNKVKLLKDVLNFYPENLSGGQRQRVLIARSLILNPKFLILDEPLSALDLSIQAEIINLLKELKKDLEISYLLISHDLDVVSFLCNKIYVLYRGRVLEYGEKEKIIQSPLHPYTMYLLSAKLPKNPEEKKIFPFEEEKEYLKEGCVFISSCRERFEDCRKEPELKEVERGHFVRCFKWQK